MANNNNNNRTSGLKKIVDFRIPDPSHGKTKSVIRGPEKRFLEAVGVSTVDLDSMQDGKETLSSTGLFRV